MQKKSELNNFQSWLQNEFTSRRRRNPRYSVRSFATHLEMDPSSVSQLMNGKRRASIKVITKLCEKLEASQAQQGFFLRASQAERTGKLLPSNLELKLIEEESFYTISDWYHFAILELTFVSDFRSEASWIAKALGITVIEAETALDRLERSGLLKKVNKKFVKSNKSLTNFAPGMTSAAHRNLQLQVVQMAGSAIDTISASEKEITSMTAAIDVSKIPQARLLIAKFRRELTEFLEDGEPSKVYQLGIQLYPVSRN